MQAPQPLSKLRHPSSDMMLDFPIDPAQPPEAALADMIAAGRLADAVRFLAFGLPKREAVWWGCLCAGASLAAPRPPAEERALAAAEAWVYSPDEAHRRAAMEAAEAAGFTTPAGWSAVAAFWSGGSLAPPGMPEVAAAPALTGQAVAGAVLMAALRPSPADLSRNLRDFLDWGQDIAKGGRGKPAAAEGAA